MSFLNYRHGMENIEEHIFIARLGLEVRNTNKFMIVRPLLFDDFKYTWAEIKRNKLISQLRKRKAVINWILLIVLRIVGIIVSFLLGGIAVLAISKIKGAQHHGIMIGILGAEIIVIGCLFVFAITDFIEINYERVKIKRRGRYL